MLALLALFGRFERHRVVAHDHHGFGLSDFHALTYRAVDAAFCDWDTKQRVLARVDAGYIAAED